MKLLGPILVIVFNVFATPAYTQSNLSDYAKEQRYDAVMAHFANNKASTVNFFNADFADEVFDVLWDLSGKDQLKAPITIKSPELKKLTLLQKIKYLALKREALIQVDTSYLTDEIVVAINNKLLGESEVTFVTSYRNFLPKIVVELTKENYATKFSSLEEIINSSEILSKVQIKSIFDYRANFSRASNQQYAQTLRIYVFCRQNRAYACRMIIRDKFGAIHAQAGKYFSTPVLAKSSRDLPSSIRNGQTPQGVHTINSVMPEANRQIAFGKFRRVILNFVQKSAIEAETKEFLPAFQYSKLWWKKASIARDVGREFLRIHGTGSRSLGDRTYYPHVPTSGCISTREGKYQGVSYTDQRKVLDALMRASYLDVDFNNELKIKGALYLVEIDNKKAPVSREDLNFLF
jgi:hypothetical protein